MKISIGQRYYESLHSWQALDQSTRDAWQKAAKESNVQTEPDENQAKVLEFFRAHPEFEGSARSFAATYPHMGMTPTSFGRAAIALARSGELTFRWLDGLRRYRLAIDKPAEPV